MCPYESLTSVAAIVDWWRFCLAKGRLDPAGEFVNTKPTEPQGEFVQLSKFNGLK
jgi:hypothetical protein